MPIIRLQEENARELVTRLMGFAAHAHDSIEHMKGALLRSNWEGRSKDQFRQDLSEVSRTLTDQIDALEQLAIRLQYEIDEWLDTDARGRASFAALQIASSMLLAGGLAAALNRPRWLDNLQGWFGTWWAGILEKLGITPKYIESPPEIKVEEAPKRTALGELMAQSPPVADEPLTAEQSLAERALEVPIYGQEKAGGEAACVPTSMSMIMDYWHEKDPDNVTATRDELLAAAVEDKTFTSGKGMNFNNAERLFEENGYDASVTKFSGTDAEIQEQLETHLADKPMMAMVNLDMENNQLTTNGVTHAVVITGISEDGSLLRIHDPWGTGRAIDMDWETFKESWSGFAKDSHDYIGLTVQPGGDSE